MPDRPRITAGPESLPDSAAARLQAIADAHPDAEAEVAGGGYDPASIRVLAGMERRPRPAGFVQDSHAGRVALPVEDLSDREMDLIMASTPVGPDFSLDDLPDGETHHSIEDGPGSSVRIELSVRVLVGTERSTVLVADPVTGRALTREVLPHGREADVSAAAVEAAIRARLPGAPGGVAGAVREQAGELGE